MKLKLSLAKNPSHQGVPATCVDWSNTQEVYSAGDDNQLLSWSVSNNQSTRITQFHKDLFPIDLQFLPRSGSHNKHGDLILITSADGKFHIINKSGRIERSVEAHKGAVLVGQWSNDGSGLLTAGEDGYIKIWSRSGMLRSTFVSSDNSVYGACWSPDNLSIAYTHGKCVVLKQLAPNTKPLRWKAHENLILCLAWGVTSELLVSGGEDCRYRVWDSQGRQIFSSSLHDNHITSISWSPIGDLFAIGSYNTLRLCDYTGWSRSLEKPNTGSIYKISWSNDGTQMAAACANGHILFAHVVERHVHYKNFTAIISEKKMITVRNVLDDSIEQLELPERIIQMAMKYFHLVVTTPSQCYIYNINNWNTPAIFDLKNGTALLIILCEKHMLMAERNSINLYNYQGRLIASPRWPNMRLDMLKSSQITLSSDTLAIVDVLDFKIVHIIDLHSGSNRGSSEPVSTIQHTLSIIQIALDQWGLPNTRILAILDKTHDLYIVSIRTLSKVFLKLGRKIDSFQWNTEENMIAAIQDSQLVVWYCPTAAFNLDLLKLCSIYYETPEIGRSPRISSFIGNSVSLRRVDGSLINIQIPPYPTLLHKNVQDNKWNDALDLCRRVNDQSLWACLAILATQSSADVIDLAEEAYSKINHFDKVFYIQHVKSLPTKAQQKAGMALLGSAIQEAESIFLHNGMVFQAIYSNIQLHNWTRALDLAIKHKTHIDSVLYLRQKYLKQLGKNENNNKFSNILENIKIDEEKVKQKIEVEMKKIYNTNI